MAYIDTAVNTTSNVWLLNVIKHSTKLRTGIYIITYSTRPKLNVRDVANDLLHQVHIGHTRTSMYPTNIHVICARKLLHFKVDLNSIPLYTQDRDYITASTAPVQKYTNGLRIEHVMCNDICMGTGHATYANSHLLRNDCYNTTHENT